MTDAWAEAGVLEEFRHDLAARLVDGLFEARPSPLPVDLYYDAWIPARAIEHIDALPADGPWFCTVSFTGPHEPWDAPEPYASMFDPADAPAPLPVEPRDESAPPSSLDSQIRLAAGMPEQSIRALRANYAGSVALIDDQVGRLIDAVKRRGEWGRTVVAFTSDHGEMNGDHGLFYKNNFLDAAVRIPLIVRDPRRREGRRSAAPAELHDVGATLLDLAGLDPSHETFARSLVGDTPAREVALSEFVGEYMVHDGCHKLVVNTDGDAALLFDEIEDPDETTNLVRDPTRAGVIAELRDRLLRTLVRSQLGHRGRERPGGFRAQSEAAKRLLEAGRKDA
jgi:choline-sulfatase